MRPDPSETGRCVIPETGRGEQAPGPPAHQPAPAPLQDTAQCWLLTGACPHAIGTLNCPQAT